MIEKLWVEKYRPKKPEHLVGNENIKEILKSYIEKGEIPHLMFYGSPGTGKTTIAKILINNLDCEYRYINGSDENGIDVMRNKIGTFAESVTFAKLKIILIDEADYLTLNSQSVLRNTLESFSDNVRFIFTCNYPRKMMDALHSRCQGFEIKPPEREGLEKRAKAILKKEGIEFEEEDVNDIVRNCYPDIRKMINTLQQFSKDGKLKIESGAIVSDAYKTDLINALKEKKSFTDIRQIVINANSMEYDTIYRLLFDSVKEYCEVKSNIGQIMLDISEHLYRDAFVVDKEINLSACILKVLKLLKN